MRKNSFKFSSSRQATQNPTPSPFRLLHRRRPRRHRHGRNVYLRRPRYPARRPRRPARPNLRLQPRPAPRLVFQTRLLVDFDDGRTYPVPEDLDGDSLARLQDVWLCGPGGDALILKTGRIQWQEKEDFWRQNDTVYTDQMETIAFCRTGDLIHSIKAGRAIPWTIVDRSDRSSALNVLESDHQYLYYWKKDFRSGVTLLTHFPLDRSATPDDLQRYPFAEREWWWAAELVRLRDRQPLFRTLGEKAVYTDGDHVLTSEWPADPDKRGVRFRLRRRSDGEVLEEWNNRYYAYHSYDDRVVLY